eukprot:GHVS01041555.1.p1 GENE.GHVS01041555.1~~GHVS01041555.1.p1  ORF type:complete len:581 (-),score=114.38 GHVS01041555.1:73-1815(-)
MEKTNCQDGDVVEEKNQKENTIPTSPTASPIIMHPRPFSSSPLPLSSCSCSSSSACSLSCCSPSSCPSPSNFPLNVSRSIRCVAASILSGRCRRIVVAVGAGISVSAGIPDFRSPNSGLYSKIKKQQDGCNESISSLPKPEAIFDLDYFRVKPKAFCILAKELFPGNFCPTKAHMFSVLLQSKGLLLRQYTQNIDTLERRAGLDAELLVEAHGSFAKVHCIECGREAPLQEYKRGIFADVVPLCRGRLPAGSGEGREHQRDQGKQEAKENAARGHSEEKDRSAEYTEPGGKVDQGLEQQPGVEADTLLGLSQKFSTLAVSKNTDFCNGEQNGNNGRNNSSSNGKGLDTSNGCSDGGGGGGIEKDGISSDSSGSNVVLCGGLLKPDITFFGESLDERFFNLCTVDFPSAELLIVMGTSLQVMPFAHLVHMCTPSCDRLMINKDYVKNFRPRNAARVKKEKSHGSRTGRKPEGTRSRKPKSGKRSDLENLAAEETEQTSPSSSPSFSSDRSWWSSEETDSDGAKVGRGERIGRDYFVKGACDEGVEQLCDCLGWRDELEQLYEDCKATHRPYGGGGGGATTD